MNAAQRVDERLQSAPDTTVDFDHRLHELLAELRQLPAERRQEFLERVCAGRDSLRAQLESLLAESNKVGSDGSTAFPDTLDHIAHRLRLGLAAATGTKPQDALLGRRLGPFEITEFIASGGMGSVYKAVRVDDFRQVVALKLVRGGLADAELVQRFTTERQVLADLNHPHICRLLDGGTTDEHWPYLVMEFIEGRPIHRFCDEQQSSTAARALLVQQICQAVQFAHECGVVHRDIKPGNVLVTADGMSKLTDFGLAKQLDDDQSQTETGQILGTPSYMAPEQAAGRTGDIGPLTDVYAIGAVLYELLVGRPPFKGTTMRETLEQVCAQEPVPPRRLQPRLPRDLETICLKCLEKQPSKRYAGAAALSADLRRFLAGEPIQARPIGNVERLARWCRRKPMVASLLAILIVVVVGSIVGLTGLWLLAEWRGEQAIIAKNLEVEAKNKEIEAKNQAIEAKKRAARQRENALDALEEMNGIAESVLAADPGRMKLQLITLEKTLQIYRELGQDPDGAADAKLQHKTAQTCFFLGRARERLGEPAAKTVPLFQEAAAIWKGLDEKYPNDLRYATGLHGCYDRLAGISSFPEAVETRKLALACAQALVDRNPNDPISLDILANEHNIVATNAVGAGDLASAKEHINKAMDISKALFKKTDRPFFALQISRGLYALGGVHEKENDLPRARQTYEAAAHLHLQLSKCRIPELDMVDNAVNLPVEAATFRVTLARLQYLVGDKAAAVASLRDSARVLDDFGSKYGDRYSIAYTQYPVHIKLADYLLATGKDADARNEHRLAVEILRKIWDRFPAQRSLTNAQLLDALCNYPAAWRERHQEELSDLRTKLGEANGPSEATWLGVLLYRQGKARESIDYLKKDFKGDLAVGCYLAMACLDAGDRANAESYFRAAEKEISNRHEPVIHRLLGEAALMLKRK